MIIIMSNIMGHFQTSGLSEISLVLSLLFALASCFLGYKLLKLWIALFSLFGGFLLGFGTSSLFTGQIVVCIISGLVVGIILVALSFTIYLFGVFLLCSGVSYLCLATLLTPTLWWSYGICGLGAVAIGIIAVFIVRPIVIVTTAIQGGLTAVSILFQLFQVDHAVLSFLLGLLLGILGMVVQFRTDSKQHGKPNSPPGGNGQI